MRGSHKADTDYWHDQLSPARITSFQQELTHCQEAYCHLHQRVACQRFSFSMFVQPLLQSLLAFTTAGLKGKKSLVNTLCGFSDGLEGSSLRSSLCEGKWCEKVPSTSVSYDPSPSSLTVTNHSHQVYSRQIKKSTQTYGHLLRFRRPHIN